MLWQSWPHALLLQWGYNILEQLWFRKSCLKLPKKTRKATRKWWHTINEMDFQSDMVTIKFKEKMKKNYYMSKAKFMFIILIYIYIYILIYIFLLLKKRKKKLITALTIRWQQSQKELQGKITFYISIKYYERKKYSVILENFCILKIVLLCSKINKNNILNIQWVL